MVGDGTQSAALAVSKSQEKELQNLQLQVNHLKNSLTPGQNAQQRLRKACNDFEAVFISKLWQQMRATVPKNGPLHSQQEEMYQSMFDRDFAEKLASDGGIGLGDMMYEQLKGKIKNTTKVTGQSGLNTPAAAKAQADAAARTQTGHQPHHRGRTGAIDPTSVNQQQKPEGKLDRALLHALNPAHYQTAGATGAAGATVGMAPSATPTLTSPRATAGMAPSATPTLTSPRTSTGIAASGHSRHAKAPSPPASVAGDVMPQVDALAQRILEDYDHKLRVDGVHPDQLARRRVAAETMQAAAAYRNNANQKDDERRTTGHKLATIG